MYMQGAVGLGAVDHIPAQNQAGADLAAVVAQWQSAKNAGTLYLSVAQNLSAKAKQIGDTFATWARSLMNPRANAGASQIETLANGIASDIMKDVQAQPAGAQPQAVDNSPVTYSGQPEQPLSIGSSIQRIVGTVIHDVTGAINNPTPYGPDVSRSMLPPQSAPGMPSWALPAAAVAAVWFFLKRKK